MATSDVARLFSVAGKRVLVTGGSRGIGAMVAEGFLRAGADVVISARKRDELERAAAQLGRLGRCEAVQADLSTLDGVRALAAAVGEGGRALDVLVNNAGATWGAPLDDFPPEGWDKVLDTNVRGAFFLTTALLEPLRAAASADDPARVLNIGSIDGLRVPPWDNFPYTASKAALHMLTRHLARRLAGDGITVNAIAPGFFESRMTAFLLDEADGREEVEAEVPLGRVGRPEEISGLALFLASRAGSYMTGAVVPLDGGASA